MSQFIKTLFFILVIVVVPGYFIKKWIQKRKHTGTDLFIVKDKHGHVIANRNDFEGMVAMLEKSDSGLQFIALLPRSEQIKLYTRFINDYVVTNHVIQKYIHEKGLDKGDTFNEEFEQYIKIMKSNFYSATFQKHLSETLTISDSEAEEAYSNERADNPRFLSAPFAKKVPGVEGRIVKIDEGKSVSDYAERLKTNKDVIRLERINKGTKGLSPKIVTTFESMKDGDIKAVTMENGITFAAYRIKNHHGEWAPYKEVASEVKEVLLTELLEKQYKHVVDDLKEREGIAINHDYITSFVDKKVKEKDEAMKNMIENNDPDILEKEGEKLKAIAENSIKKELKEATAKN